MSCNTEMIHAASPPTLCLPQSSGSYSQCVAPTLVTQHCEVAEWLSPSLWRTLSFCHIITGKDIVGKLHSYWRHFLVRNFMHRKTVTLFSPNTEWPQSKCAQLSGKDFNWWLIVRVIMRPEFWPLLIASHGLEWRAVLTCDPLSAKQFWNTTQNKTF